MNCLSLNKNLLTIQTNENLKYIKNSTINIDKIIINLSDIDKLNFKELDFKIFLIIEKNVLGEKKREENLLIFNDKKILNKFKEKIKKLKKDFKI